MDVKRIEFHKSGNSQRKGEINRRQDNQGSYQHNQGQARENRTPRAECKHYGKKHLGVCNKINMTCYRCNQKGHFANECKAQKTGITCFKYGKPGHMTREYKSSGPIRSMMSVAATCSTVPAEVLDLPTPSETVPQVSAKTFDLKMKDAVQNSEVIAVKLSVNNIEAKVLIDSGATRSFISETFVDRLGCDTKTMSEVMNVVIANQEKIPIDCRSKKVYLRAESGKKVIFRGQRQGQLFLTVVQAKKFLRKGCEAFLAYVVDTKREVPSLEEILVVKEFSDVFPEELPGLPPDRQIEFKINLAPGAEPVSKAPYRMEPMEMKELTSQLQELLDKGVIRPSMSPWGAPVLFVKKEGREYEIVYRLSGVK
ncbi:uncharacterized protein LOC141680191 [Apium graveolens]|uniref:uncharacterized protein LOC141680191 n=1 Tax=Apium graveolens TaxID=4045 RepID=UPI003D7BED22